MCNCKIQAVHFLLFCHLAFLNNIVSFCHGIKTGDAFGISFTSNFRHFNFLCGVPQNFICKFSAKQSTEHHRCFDQCFAGIYLLKMVSKNIPYCSANNLKLCINAFHYLRKIYNLEKASEIPVRFFSSGFFSAFCLRRKGKRQWRNIMKQLVI